jgi:hypothetical protein
VSRSIDYYNKPGLLNLIKETRYLVFIIYSSFIISNSSKVYIGNRVGYYIDSESILTLEKQIALVIIVGP